MKEQSRSVRDIRWMRLACRWSAAVVGGALAASPAAAHGFGQRFDLPLPLWLWVSGAGASIVLSFVVMAIFVREREVGAGYPYYNLLELPFLRWAASPLFVGLMRLLGVIVFVTAIAAGFFGAQDSFVNIIVTLIWVTWWVGVAFICALIGNLWRLINPLSTLFGAAEWALAKLTGRGLSLDLPYPRWLGRWPAVLFFLGFAWLELVWQENDIPQPLAGAVLNYAIISFVGMFLFGRETWLRNGEAFTVAFGVLSRFAPLHVPAREEEGRGPVPRLELRSYGAGLMDYSMVTVSLCVFVLLMLSTVTFDGFLETPLFRDLSTAVFNTPTVARLLFALSEYGIQERVSEMTALLVLFPLLFTLVYFGASAIMVRVTRQWGGPNSGAGQVTTSQGAFAFVLTLVPIAVAYHLSHYFSFLFTTGQYIIPLISDPFGWGTNFFGTAGFKVNFTVLSPYVYWYASVFVIIVGHVIAVYLAHVVALRLFGTRRAALVSQLPMVVLMVLYTSLSLWILAQPILG